MKLDFNKLSRTISHALRHDPKSYGLNLDESGWVNLSDLVDALRKIGWTNIQSEDIILMVQRAEKKRHQIFCSRIRAYYGHSTAEIIVKPSKRPPSILYHGTSLSKLEKILDEGLLPMDRHYVHLSEEKETAQAVASRRHGKVKILIIRSLQAHNSGIPFYKEENSVWLSGPIPSVFIQF